MFEESKYWILLLLVGILISLGYVTHYLNSVDEANLALQESKSKLSGMQEQLFHLKKEWGDREQAVSKVQIEADKNAKLLTAQEALEMRYRKTEGELKYVLESMKTSVEKARSNATGMELGEITLTNSRVLRGVKIRKVEESGISLIYSDGIGTPPLDLLPENLKEQYDLGPNALVPQIEKALTALLIKPKVESRMEQMTQPVVQSSVIPQLDVPATPATTVDDAAVKKIKLRMVELESQISSYVSSIKQFKETAASHQSLASSAKGRGQPSTRHTENANECLAKADALEKRVASLSEERKKLDVELEFATKPK